MDQYYSSRTDQCYSSVLQLSFIYKIKENTSLRHEGMLTQKMQRERERDRDRELVGEKERVIPGPLAPLFMFFPPPGPALCKLG